jgi:glucan phosphorylase
MVAVTLVHRHGYFFQRLDESGWQSEEPANWHVEGHLSDTGTCASVTIETRPVRLRVGRYDVQGDDEHIVPADLDAVRRQCLFTTDTPVPAGHDQFDPELVDRVLGDRQACGINDPICHANRLNMT